MSIYVLSEEAQSVVDMAQQVAHRKHQEELDSSHLFYALLKESRAGKEWLQQAARDNTDEFLADLEDVLSVWYPTSADYTEPSGMYLKVMHSAEKVAANLRAEFVTPTHLLKAVIEQDQRLSEWLSQRGIAPTQVRISPETPILDQVSRDLTLLAKENKLTPVIGREKEVQQLVEILLQRGKNSALLLGPAGVGKSAIAERLAQDIVNGEVPRKLQDVRLVELNLGALLAGTSYRGEFEERMQNLLKEIAIDRNIILVIDEFHALVGTGTTLHGGPDAVSILKPALARGDITCIGITTDEDFTRSVEFDSALVRRFQIVRVEEPSQGEVAHILENIAPNYSSHHHVEIPKQILEAIVHWTDRYQPNRHFPDKAIDILGKSCARAELQKLVVVTLALVAEILTEITGVPVGELDANLRNVLVNLDKVLNQRIIGQESAIQTLCQVVRLSYSGLRDPHRPKGIFLFLGPSGVGKTELARALAEELFGSEEKLIRFDMSEYSERINISRLIGAAPGYVGHDEPGQLTQALRNHPHSVVLFDEIEKACPDVFDLFLQLFDEGRLTDSHGNLADGRNAVFIMTSNIGTTSDAHKEIGFIPTPSKSERRVEEIEIQSFFRPEFVNRIDHIIHFRSLDTDDLIEIGDMEIRLLKQRLSEQDIRLTYEQDVLPVVIREATRVESGARGIKNAIESLIAIPLSELLLQQSATKDCWIHVRSDGNDIRLEWM